MKNVAKIKQEGSFGELELISNSPEHQRNGATIKCETETTYVTLGRSTF